MTSKEVLAVLKFIPKLSKSPWPYSFTCILCKCKKHLKVVAVNNPSKRLHFIWIFTMSFHFLVIFSVFLKFILELHKEKRTITKFQALVSIVTVAGLIAVAPLQLCLYRIRNFAAVNEMLLMERRMKPKKKHNQDRSK